MKKTIAIKIFLGAIGAIYTFFGTSALVLNFVYFIRRDPIFEVILPIKILTVFYYIYLLYSVILGICIYCEKVWTSKGVIPIPIFFIFFEYFSEPKIEISNYILLLTFFIISAIFLNVRVIKTYLIQK